jgi:hypothetical protein
MSEAPTTTTTETAQSTPSTTVSTEAPAAGGATTAEAPAAPSDPASILFPEDKADTDASTGEPASQASTEEGSGDTPPAPDPIDPASYELALPEGFTLDDALMSDARSALADAGVPKDKAQGLLDLWARSAQAQATAAQTEFEAQNTANLAAIDAMPEFQGPTRETSLTAIGKLLDEYGPEAKAGILSNPAVGNDPALAKFMLSVAKALSEGSATSTGRPPPQVRKGSLFSSADPAENSVNAKRIN